MNSIITISVNTFREIIRDRILYGIVVFALLLIGLSIALGNLSFAEQSRISADMGFAGIQVGLAILSVFVGSTLVAREIEKQTILTLLARPISRTQFLLGKLLGINLVVIVVMIGLSVVLGLVLFFLGFEIKEAFFEALWGIFLECSVLIALTLFFGVFSRPMMSVMFVSAFFLIGHWVSTLDSLINKGSTEAFKAAVQIFDYTIPNFERFNWRSAPIYDAAISASELFSASAYAVGWIVLLIALTAWIFRSRDFV
jgi:ABC-type transport system involved in multi-copper enzyme maturation permease subunit